MTLDLLFKDNKWVDDDNYDWSKYVKFEKDKYSEDEIYRLYPISLNKYEPRECRFDKRKPNSYKITNLINMYKFDWNQNLVKYLLYKCEKFCNKKWRNILENQFKTLVMMIKLLNPDVKKHDFGW